MHIYIYAYIYIYILCNQQRDMSICRWVKDKDIPREPTGEPIFGQTQTTVDNRGSGQPLNCLFSIPIGNFDPQLTCYLTGSKQPARKPEKHHWPIS